VTRHPWVGYESTDLTELRVHGAGAAPIEDLLDSDSYVRVAGDDIAGFYRVPPSDAVTELDEDDPRSAAHSFRHEQSPKVNGEIEAYHWGKMSTGGGWRAFWILLLPFALINLAGWTGPRRAGFTQRLVRIFGILTSITLVYWIAAISLGVLSECGPGSLCAERKFYLSIANISFFAERPSRLALISLALGVVVVFALWWWPGRHSADEYERYTPRESANDPDAAASATFLSFDGPALWYSERASKRLAAAHILAMLSALAAGSFVAVGDLYRSDRIFEGSPYFAALPKQVPALIFLSICLLIIGGCILYVASIDPIMDFDRDENLSRRRKRDPGAWAFGLGFVLVLISAFWIWVTPVQGELGSEITKRIEMKFVYYNYANTGFSAIVSILVLVSIALIITRLVDLLLPRRDTGRYSMGGFGPIVLSATGVVLLAAMVSGMILWVADLFGEPDYQLPPLEQIAELEEKAGQALLILRGIDVSDGVSLAEFAQIQEGVDAIGRFRDVEAALGEPLIRLGDEYYMIPLAFMVVVVLILIVVAGVSIVASVRLPWKNMFRSSRIDRPIVKAINNVRTDDQSSRTKLAKEIAGLLKKPYRNSRLHIIFVIPAVAFIALLPLALIAGDDLQEMYLRVQRLLRPAVWLTVGVFLLMAFAVRDYYRGGSTRGALGGMWDILTFWPRFYHPFAPPSYAVRSVPEIAERTTELTKDDRRLVLSAHSQGVPTTLAALSLITDPQHRSRIALLTYGSPTGMLYSRFFPDYFGADQLGRVAASLKVEHGVVRWSNLWRLTDWTGGYVMGRSRDRYFPLLPQFASGEEFDASGKPLYVTQAQDLKNTITESRLSDPDPNAILGVSATDPLPRPTGHGDYLHYRLYPDFRSKLVDSLYVGWTKATPELAGVPDEKLTREAVQQSLTPEPDGSDEDSTGATANGDEL
jgi:hypothetical protein